MKPFYVGIYHRDGIPWGHFFSPNKPDITNKTWKVDANEGGPNNVDIAPENFKQIMQNFSSMMSVYRNFVPGIIRAAPLVAGKMAVDELNRFVSENGIVEEKKDDDTLIVYKLASEKYREFIIKYDSSVALHEGNWIIASSMLIGLVSTYDAMMADLLRHCIRRHPEIVINKDRILNATVLLEFESIDALKEILITNEVESTMRDSHAAQFDYIRTKLNFDTKEHIEDYASFIEVCERRNLMTHTGGVVSKQYISVCKKAGVKAKLPNEGARLGVDVNYFGDAIRSKFRLGMKLIYSLWLKIEREKRREATESFNETCFDLIYNELYSSAASLLTFALDKPSFPIEDRPKKVATMNCANAYRLLGNKEKARTIVGKEDWSAAGPDFQICLAALREDDKEIKKVMLKHPDAISSESYKTWPVFREKDYNESYREAFAAAYREIFCDDYIFFSEKTIANPKIDAKAKLNPAASP